MGYSRKSLREAIPFRDVFQHHAGDAEDLRKAIVGMIHECLERQQPIATFPVALYYGSYNLRGKKDVHATLDELAWKRSELTGKFCGCPFWSRKAKCSFDEALRGSAKGRPPTLQDGWRVANSLAEKATEKDRRLTHEHVFPRADLIRLLQAPGVLLTPDALEALTERLAIGCVVLQSEHCSLESRGHASNPWLRYKDLVPLAENPEWPDFQRQMIVEAGLVSFHR